MASEGQKWLQMPKLASEGTNWPRPKLFSEGTKGPKLVSEAQIDFRKPKIGFRRPNKGTNWLQIASEGKNWFQAQIGFRRPKIGFRRPKSLALEGPKLASEGQNSKLTSEGLKLASVGQHWLQKATIGFRRPKLISQGPPAKSPKGTGWL